jgi:hypothetical protein
MAGEIRQLHVLTLVIECNCDLSTVTRLHRLFLAASIQSESAICVTSRILDLRRSKRILT